MKQGHFEKNSFIFIFTSSIRDIRNSGNYLNCNCYISCSLAIQIADEHISISHLKQIYYISWLRKVLGTAWLMLNLFCKWSHSRVIFSLRSSFNILFPCVWDLLLNHRSNFLIPFEYPASSIERKREYYRVPTTLDFSWFVSSGAILCVGISKALYQGDWQSRTACSSLQSYCCWEQQEAAGPRRAELPAMSLQRLRPVPAG